MTPPGSSRTTRAPCSRRPRRRALPRPPRRRPPQRSRTDSRRQSLASGERLQCVFELLVLRFDLEAALEHALRLGRLSELQVNLAEGPVDLALGDAGLDVDVLQHERLVDLARLLPVLEREVEP